MGLKNVLILSLLAVSCVTSSETQFDDGMESDLGIVFHDPKRISASSDADFFPEVSQNGDHVFYVADRLGNKDIWKKPAVGGVATRITNHVADDFKPMLSPDGSQLAFVSRRDDALGDIYIMDLASNIIGGLIANAPENPLTRIFHPDSEDSSPSWSADGKSVIFTSKRFGSDESEILRYDVKSKIITDFGKLYGSQASVSPDGKSMVFVRSGTLFIYDFATTKVRKISRNVGIQDGQPRFGPNSDELLFIRYLDDTNRDGKLDAEDRPTLWMIKGKIGEWGENDPPLVPKVLSSPRFGGYSPVHNGRWVYAAIETPDGINIYRLPEAGHVQPKSLKTDVDQFVFEIDNHEDELYLLRRFQAYYLTDARDERKAGLIALKELRKYASLRRFAEANIKIREIQDLFARHRGLSLLVEIESLALSIHRFTYPFLERELSGIEREQNAGIKQKVREILSSVEGDGRLETEDRNNVKVTGLTLLAQISASERDFVEANRCIELAAKYPAMDPEISGRAELLKALLAKDLAGEEASLKLLTAAARQYKGQKQILQQAREFLWKVISESDLPEEALQKTLELGQGIPYVLAHIHFDFADRLKSEKKDAVYANELRQIVERYRWDVAVRLEAARNLSQYKERQGDFEGAATLWAGIQQTFVQKEGRSYGLLKAAMEQFHLRYGYVHLSEGKFKEARGECEISLKLSPNSLNAHRCLIDASVHLSSIESIVEIYQKKALETESSPFDLYLLGYALTYTVDAAPSESARINALEKVISVLEKARELDSQMPQVHQTLGWAYFQIGHWRKVAEESGGFKEGLRRKLLLVKGFFGVRQTAGVEDSIDAFDTAYYLSPRGSAERAVIAQNLGHSFYELQSYQKSLDYFLERISKLDVLPISDKRVEGALLRWAGRAAFQIENLELAVNLQKAALAVWEKVGIDKETAYSLDALALTYREMGQWGDATALYLRLLRLDELLGSRENRVGTLTNLGYCFFSEQKYEQALEYFEQAAVLISDLERSPKEGENIPKKDKSAIAIDVAGEQSAAKGFDLFTRRNLVVTFKSLIHERMGRLDLAASGAREKIGLLEAEDVRRANVTGKENTLADARVIARSRLGYLSSKIGEEKSSSQSYGEAADLARKNRPEKQDFPGVFEIQSEINRARLRLRMSSLGLIGQAETQEEVERIKGLIRGLQRDESSPLVERPKWIFDLVKNGRSLEKTLPSNSPSEFPAMLRKELERPDFNPETSGVKPLSLAAARQLMPELGHDFTAVLGAEKEGGDGQTPKTQKEAGGDQGWIRLVTQGQYEQAWVALEKSVRSGATTSSPVERLAMRNLWEALSKKKASQANRAELFESWRTFLTMKYVDLMRRGGILPKRASGQDTTSRDAASNTQLPNYLATSLSSIQEALSEKDGILMAHRVLGGGFYLGLITKGGTQFWQGNISGVDDTTIRGAILQSGMLEGLSFLDRLYLAPTAELFDVAWENILKAALHSRDRVIITFIPSPDIVPILVKSRLSPRDRVAFVGPKAMAGQFPGRAELEESMDRRAVSIGDIVSAKDNLDSDEVIHVSSPIYLNDVEPHLSSTIHGSLGDMPNSFEGAPPSLYNFCVANSKAKGFVVLADVFRSTTDFERNIDAHDGWAYAILCSLHYGTPTVLWNQAEIGPKSEEQGTKIESKEKQFWADFYHRLSESSLRDTLTSLRFRGRVLGDVGLTTDEEKKVAKESFDTILEEAEDSDDDGHLTKSKELYRKALFLARIGGISDQSRVLTKLVGNLFKLRDFKSAYYYQRKKVDLISQLPNQEENQALGEALVDAAVLAVRAEHYEQAKNLLDRAEAFYKAAANFKVLGKIDQYRAINAENQGSYEESIAWYQTSRAYYLKVDEDEAAQRLLNIGNIYNSRLSDLPRALEYYHKALAFFREEDQIESEIKVLIDISNALIAIGDLGQAISILESQVLKRISKDRNLDVWIRSQQMLANAYLRRGQFEYAQRLCAQIIEAAAKMTDAKDLERRDQRLIDAFGLRAYLLAAQGLFKESFLEFESTIEKAIEKKFEQQAAILFNNYGFWLREVGNLEKSVKMLEKAEGIDAKLKSKSGLAVDRRNLGLSLIAIGDLSRAKDLLERSLDESKKLFLTYNIAYCHFGLGDIAIREGRLSESDNHFRQALALAQKGMMPDMEWRAFGAIGRVAQINGRNKDAIVAFRQALEKLEEREGGLRSEASRNAFQSDAGTQEIYAHFAKVLMDEGEIAEAWQVAERARSRAYIDAIGTRSVELARQKSRDLKDRERSARLEMEQSLLANRISPENLDLRARAESSTKMYSSLLTEIEKADFQLLDLLRVRKVSLSAFIKEVPDGVAVLSYLVTPSHLLIWSLSGGEIRGAQVPLAADKLEKLTKEYRGLFESLSSTEFVGKELAEALIKPVSDSLTKASHIVLIPHRSLHFVPFAALPIGTGYLTDIAPISYVESARVASYLLSRRDRVRVGRGRKIIALIDPKRSNPSIPRLPYTEKEVDAMKRFFSNVTRLDGEKASEDVLRRGTKDYQVLHIGSHGEFRSDQPTASRLLLSETETSDGNLDVVDILGLPEQADNVTLSACESGRGYVGSGDDVVSLDRAFFYAGAKTVVSSLWRISDVTSAVVMKRYYRYLSDGDSPSKAMQKAQLVVRKYFQHPAYWASFRVIGDGL